jgi:hypothetical protein
LGADILFVMGIFGADGPIKAVLLALSQAGRIATPISSNVMP